MLISVIRGQYLLASTLLLTGRFVVEDFAKHVPKTEFGNEDQKSPQSAMNLHDSSADERGYTEKIRAIRVIRG